MAEALAAVIAYGFKRLELLAVEAHTYSRNPRARRVLEKLGFAVERVEGDSHSYALPIDRWERMSQYKGTA